MSKLIPRPEWVRKIKSGLKAAPVTAILGPRQCGKTTLARIVAKRYRGTYFDLEDRLDSARLERPQQVLEQLRGLVVLDEIQLRQELFPLLRVLSDRKPLPCRFLVLGNASPRLMRRTSETLAGRVRFVEMRGFGPQETGWRTVEKLWLRGSFPRSFLAKNDADSLRWREDFIRTFLERDIPQLDIHIPAETLRRFWTMVSHYHGQVWNASEIGASLGFSHNAARRYLDLLAGAFVLRQLPPYYVNIGKRIVKSPKIYVRDSGLLHSLLNIRTFRELDSHPKLGASWEGFAIEQVLQLTGERNAFFWGTHGGAEIDLVVEKAGKVWGFEFKCIDAPTLTKSMHTARQDLKLEHLWIIYPGRKSYPIGKWADVLALRDLSKLPRTIIQ